MSLDKIQAGDYGAEIQLTILDIDTGSAADLSSYTTAQEMIFEDPDGVETTKTAAFATDGSDGVVAYTVQDGDIDQAGVWRVRPRVKSGSSQLTGEWVRFAVEE